MDYDLTVGDVVPLLAGLHKDNRLVTVVNGICGGSLETDTRNAAPVLATLAVANRLWCLQPLYKFSDHGIVLGLQRLERTFGGWFSPDKPFQVLLQDGRKLEWEDGTAGSCEFDLLSMSANDEQYGQLPNLERLELNVDRMVDILCRGALAARAQRK